MKSRQVRGFVLRKQPFKDNGFLIDLFTHELGHITVLVRSIRQRKQQPHLELFSLAIWHLTEGKSFYFFNDYELITTYSLTGREIWTAYYLNELLIRLYPKHQVDEELFERYIQMLVFLTQKNSIEAVLRQFECCLLESLGILPDFEYDSHGERVKSGRTYFIHHELGVLQRSQGRCFEISGDLLIQINAGSTLEKGSAQQFKQLMRYLLAPLLGNRPLQSRLWLKKLYQRGH